MKAGDPVVYLRDPLLYSEMEIAHVRKDGKLVCIIDPDSLHPSFEVFEAQELDVSSRLAA